MSQNRQTAVPRTAPTPPRARLAPVALAALLVVLVGCDVVSQKMKSDDVEMRLKTVLDAMVAGRPSDNETAICMYYMGKWRCGDMNTLETALNGFEQWLDAKDFRMGIESYEILGQTLVEDAKVPTTRFRLKINGKNAYILVPTGHQLQWDKKRPGDP